MAIDRYYFRTKIEQLYYAFSYLVLFWIPEVSDALTGNTANESVVTIRIKENIPKGSIISRLSDVIIPRPSQLTTFTLMKNRFFTVTDYDKVIVIGEIDRDNDSDICMERSSNRYCVWKNILISSDSVHFIIKVIIDDENDNSPSWAEESMIIKVTENISPASFLLELPKAHDPDNSPNSTALYVIDPPSNYVAIINKTDPHGLTPYLKLKNTFNRETTRWHNVTLLAIDGGSPARTGSLRILIKIIDINDNTPVFESSVYRYSLRRTLKLNDSLDLRIKATDADEGMNGNITYSISLNSPFIIQQCLRINSISAIITIIKPLMGYCLLPEYRFSVVASDNGYPTLSSKTDVLLTFDDQNTYAPDITMYNKEPYIQIFENNAVGSHLRTIAVTDRDTGRSGEFQCLVNGNRTTGKVSMTSNKSGVGDITIIQLVAVGVFDRETELEIYITIVCTDFGQPSLSSSKNLVIEILDVNDNAPCFNKTLYRLKTYEENEPYQIIAQLTAYDLDNGPNSMLTYRIESKTNEDIISLFTIDFHGNIIAKERLDRERFPNGFNFTVIATDQGRPSLTGSTLINLELLDINDNSPVFSMEYYNFLFVEDIGSKHQRRMVGQVIAGDYDLYNNSLITYTLSTISPMPFMLNSSSGDLYSCSIVDRESQVSNYSVSILAMDNPSNKLYRRTSTVSVTIYIVDYNDNTPTFVFPNDENNRVQLSYHSRVGTVVTTVKATDIDIGLNSKIKYSLVDPDRNILFAINQSSGELLVSTTLNSIHEGVEHLFVRASDCGSPSLTTVQKLVIEISEHKQLRASNSDNRSLHNDPLLSDRATYVIVGIVLGTFFVCCSLVAGICTLTYRQWRHASMNPVESSDRQYVAVDDPNQLQSYIDNYLEMKEIT